ADPDPAPTRADAGPAAHGPPDCSRGQRSRGSAGIARQAVSSAGDWAPHRHRVGAEPRARVLAAHGRAAGVRFPAGPHGVPPAAASGGVMRPVWILDDEPGMRWVLEKALGKEGWAVRCFAESSALMEALEALDESDISQVPAVLVSDVRMPGLDGLGVLTAVRERLPRMPVIMMTAFTDLKTTVAAFEQGAFDYLAKPFDIRTAVDLISRAAQFGTQAAADPAVPASEEPGVEAGMVLSHSPTMQPVFRAIGRLSASSATVLITGESGTGKELIARALHQHSPRAAGPFIAINTAAIPK